jgi:hypothetical protein
MRDLAVNLDPNQVSPGLLGFIIVCILGVGVWLLCRSMGKHLTKLDAEYQAEQTEQAEPSEPSDGKPADAPLVPSQQK